MNEPIIDSLLDSDLYKFSMQQAVFHQYPKAFVRYEFKCRNEGVKLGFLASSLIEEVEAWQDIKLSATDARFLSDIPYFKDDYIDWLAEQRFDPAFATIKDEDGDLTISIEGEWMDTILFEVPILATVNELYFRSTTNFSDIRAEGQKRLFEKIEMAKPYPQFKFAEFGTRRRYSKDWQR